MKKFLALSLALVMCLSLITIPASAAAAISVNKTSYDPGGEIVVTVSGVTAAIVDGGAFAAVYKVGAAGTDYGDYAYVDEGTNTYNLNAPDESGQYEIRLIGKDEYPYDNVAAKSASFTVGKVASAGSISLDKKAYTAFDPITVTVSGITEQMVTAKAAVGVYAKGGAHGDVYANAWFYPSAGNSTQELSAPNKNGEFEMRLYSNGTVQNAENLIMSIPFTVSGATGSDWAADELTKANNLGLIPDTLKGKDLAGPITRAEFAAVAVKVFENLSGTKTTPSADSTFTDTKDVEVLKAHNTGLMVGVSATTFEPNTLLNREQAATALTRVLKRAYIPGWTFATDAQFKLNFTRPATFADDAQISDWAKESVYFMAANSIILGVGENKFAPKATTSAEQAAGYATATREQAIIIGMRLVDNLKDKPVDYTKGDAPQPTPEPTTPPSGSIDTKLTGHWKYRGSYYDMGIRYTSFTDYYFNSNGTFECEDNYFSHLKYTGTYSAAGGKVHFTILKGYEKTFGGDWVELEKDEINNWEVVMEYKFGTDSEGEYLSIFILGRQDKAYFEVPTDSSGIQFRKQ